MTKRKCVWCGIILAALFIASGVALTWWDSRLERQARAILVDAEDRVAALVPERVPDDENAASLYLEAFAEMRSQGKVIAPDLFDSRVDLGELRIGSREVQAFLGRYQQALGLLSRAASRTKCDFRVDHLDGRARSLLPQRNAGILLCLAARVAAHRGKSSEAVERIREALHLYRSAGEKGTIIDNMVGLNASELVCWTTMHMLNEASLDEASLVKLVRHLGDCEKKRPSLVRAFDLDHAVCMVFATRALFGRWRRPPGYGIGPDPADYSGWHWITGGVIRDADRCTRLFERAMTAADAPFPKCLAQMKTLSEDPAFIADRKSVGLPYSVVTTSWYRCLTGDAASLTSLRAARAAVGCQLFRVRRGKYPATLQEMVKSLPELFPGVPEDPVTGKPLLYRRTETGLVVYGTGTFNPGDDGGNLSFVQKWDPDIAFPVDPPAYKAFLKKQEQDYKKMQLRRKRRGPVGRF